MSRRGSLCLVLHSHMPYVEGFGTWPFGEEWLWEATATVYLPLLEALSKGLTQKMLHGALAELRSAEGPQREQLTNTLSRLFLRQSTRNPADDKR